MALSRVVLLLAHLGVCVAFLPPQSILSRSGSVQTHRRSGQGELEQPVSWSVRNTPSLGFLRPSLSQQLPVTSLQGLLNLELPEIVAVAVIAVGLTKRFVSPGERKTSPRIIEESESEPVFESEAVGAPPGPFAALEDSVVACVYPKDAVTNIKDLRCSFPWDVSVCHDPRRIRFSVQNCSGKQGMAVPIDPEGQLRRNFSYDLKPNCNCEIICPAGSVFAVRFEGEWEYRIRMDGKKKNIVCGRKKDIVAALRGKIGSGEVREWQTEREECSACAESLCRLFEKEKPLSTVDLRAACTLEDTETNRKALKDLAAALRKDGKKFVDPLFAPMKNIEKEMQKEKLYGISEKSDLEGVSAVRASEMRMKRPRPFPSPKKGDHLVKPRLFLKNDTLDILRVFDVRYRGSAQPVGFLRPGEEWGFVGRSVGDVLLLVYVKDDDKGAPRTDRQAIAFTVPPVEKGVGLIKTSVGSLERETEGGRWKVVRFDGKATDGEADVSPVLFSQRPSYKDTSQGAVGNCYMIASFISYASLLPSKLRDAFVIPDGRSSSDDEEGPFLDDSGMCVVRVWSPQLSQWRLVVMDDFLPAVDKGGGSWQFFGTNASGVGRNVMWLPLLEKAFAKMQGSYPEMVGSFNTPGPHCCSQHLLGPTEEQKYRIIDFTRLSKNEKRPVVEELITLIEKGRAVVSLGSHESDEFINERTGLVDFHAYGIVSVHREPGKFSGAFMRACNTWGTGTGGRWKGDWSNQSGLWEKHPDVASALGFDQEGPVDDGTFFIQEKDIPNAFECAFVHEF
mmetsp:Transcript_13996/g.27982  ORF Transcript_13996/g.27982 Transcript_13996/m.27982 type:complete len:790 (+) Transcript_13996:92-2461(+)